MQRSPLELDRGAQIRAILGPTNTGKTHLAIERMLGYRTGMIGLPLRLLAREVYDRLVRRVGEGAVALITGEEKLVPSRPRYYVSTTESMPVDLPLDFVAIDEVQMAAHWERGHVFTDRVLRARGYKETMFLGSRSIEGVLRELVPTVIVETNPRFSRLRYTGHRKLASLPPRSAVVAFSAREVYAIAERIRARHGGVAVILGALSPRTRNAQVALYQAGEVQHMVATDAIGMGLNMDVKNVFFSDLYKFDGRTYRQLDASEIGQIAGRAGRYKQDGAFGPAGDLEAIDPQLVDAVEGHVFPPIRKVWYRNSELDMRSIDALRESLGRRPPARCLRAAQPAEDQRSLEALSKDEAIRAAARGPEQVALLWQVCQIPDFRKTLTDSHVRLLHRVYLQLSARGRLETDWVAERLRRLDRTEGDIDALTTRLAYTRTWTYIAFRGDWLEDAVGWQARTRAIEDRLSDALHERLTQRFVDRRAVALGGQLSQGEALQATLTERGQVSAAGFRLGRLSGFSFSPEPGVQTSPRILRRAARVALRPEVEARLSRLLEAPLGAITIDARGRLVWEGAHLAQLAQGRSLREPRLHLLPHDLLESEERIALRRWLEGWLKERIGASFAPLDPAPDATPGVRGLLYRLEQALGVLPAPPEREATAALDRAERRALAEAGVRLGTESIYALPLLEPAEVHLRAALWGIYRGMDPLPSPPPDEARSVPIAPRLERSFYPAIGMVPLGDRAVRADALEPIAAAARRAARDGTFSAPDDWALRLGCEPEALWAVLEALGWRRFGDPPRFGRGGRGEQRGDRGRRGDRRRSSRSRGPRGRERQGGR